MKSQSSKLIEKKRPVIGSIIEICIDDKYYTYAKKIQKERYVFFDYYNTYQIDDSKIIDRLNKLFILTIYTDTYRRPNWKVFNKIEIREDFRKLLLEFIYDKFVDQYKISDPNTIRNKRIYERRNNRIRKVCSVAWKLYRR